MKNKILSLVSVLVLAFAYLANAAAPTYTAVDGDYEYFLYSTLSPAKDTIIASDSTVMTAPIAFTPGWEYVLTTPTGWAGTGSDSVCVAVRVDCYSRDTSTTIRYSVAVDSIAGNNPAGKAIFLPFGGTLFGSKYGIKLMTYTGAGTQVITPTTGWNIWKRRVVLTHKNY